MARTEMWRAEAKRFLELSPQFRLGELPTETPHPETRDLSTWAKSDLPWALAVFKKIDLHAIEAAIAAEPQLRELAARVQEVIRRGNKIYFYGCGATGRLSLSLEVIWRTVHRGTPLEDRTVSFMSGGDIAVIRSIENFEDYPEYGARQVREIGFREGDLMIATTEGGETPSVIGAVEECFRISSEAPWVLFCNPPELLRERLERCRRFIDNPGIRKVPVITGPMAISGSTRLQATTALQLAVGSALFAKEGSPDQLLDLRILRDAFATVDTTRMKPFIEKESEIYAEKGFTLYETDRYGITILTDTTERSPTFSLVPFENRLDEHPTPALTYICFPHVTNALDGWRELLLREPYPLEWTELSAVSSMERLKGYDFSTGVREFRARELSGRRQETFRIFRDGDFLRMELCEITDQFFLGKLHPLFEHIFLKLLLNAHSSLLMGRLGRYEGNLMTWVKPSNNKLIDRSIRYIQILLDRVGVHGLPYDEVAMALFRELQHLPVQESIVLKTTATLMKKHAH